MSFDMEIDKSDKIFGQINLNLRVQLRISYLSFKNYVQES